MLCPTCVGVHQHVCVRHVLQRSILEDPASGFLQDDTLLIRYRCELLMTHGGALSNTRGSPFTAEVLCAPPATLSKELEELLYSGGVGGKLLHRVLLLAEMCSTCRLLH